MEEIKVNTDQLCTQLNQLVLSGPIASAFRGYSEEAGEIKEANRRINLASLDGFGAMYRNSLTQTVLETSTAITL